MAPTTSNRNANRRQNRPGVDHGEYEGIPIRHWRRDYVTVAPPSAQESATAPNDIWAVELPHGMPKDSHLLPQHSQELLRAARAGKIYKRPAPVDEEEADTETAIGEKPEKKDDDIQEKGFTVRSWKQLPRHLEGTGVSYLAKRRKDLVKPSPKPAAPVATVTKATVKRIDAAGNEYVQDVVVPRGQQVEGEVLSQTQIPDPSASVDLTATHAAPPKRRPASKKKAKGPGRGRKKKLAAPTSAPPQVGSISTTAAEETAGPDESNIEGTTSTPAQNEDIEMGDGSQANSDDEDGEDGDEGDEGDEDDGSDDMQDSPSKAPHQSPPPELSVPSMPPIPPLEPVDSAMSGIESIQAPPSLLTETPEGLSGSPLKQVAMTTSTVASPSEPPVATLQDKTPTTTSEPRVEARAEALDATMQPQASETAPAGLPEPPLNPTMSEAKSAVVERHEEEEEEEMLLDSADRMRREPTPPIPAETNQAKASPPKQASETAPAEEDDDDNYPDLLGRLEESLKTPQRAETPDAAKSPEKASVGEEKEEGPPSQDSEMLL